MYIQNADEYILVTSSSGSEIARSEHPRPDWKRDKWVNLNGVWDFEFDPDKVGEDEAWYAKFEIMPSKSMSRSRGNLRPAASQDGSSISAPRGMNATSTWTTPGSPKASRSS